jgi:hypothetical protein
MAMAIEMDLYKPFLRKYLVAKGFQINASGVTNCPFPEHHTTETRAYRRKMNSKPQEALKKQAQVGAEYKKKMEAKERARTEEKEVGDGSLVCVSDKLKEDLKQVEEGVKTATISTGFESLDNELGGGLRTGSLIILGGIPSLGKTTLALNIANNIAKTGRDVLFFSLEMSRVELELKSISRQTFMPDNSEHQIDSSHMKTITAKALSVIVFCRGKCTETKKKALRLLNKRQFAAFSKTALLPI